MQSVVKYVLKEDPEPLCFPNDAINTLLKCGLTKQSKYWVTIVEALARGETLRAQNEKEETRSFIAQNLQKLQFYNNWVIESTPIVMKPFPGCQTEPPITINNKKLRNWLNENMQKLLPRKSKQLFISGPTGVGKTWLIECLAPYNNVYDLADETEKGWKEGFTEAITLITLEEYDGKKNIFWMNKLLEGQCVEFAKRGRAPVKNKWRIPVIVLSNMKYEVIHSKLKEEQPELYKANYNRYLHLHYENDTRIDSGLENPQSTNFAQLEKDFLKFHNLEFPVENPIEFENEIDLLAQAEKELDLGIQYDYEEYQDALKLAEDTPVTISSPTDYELSPTNFITQADPITDIWDQLSQTSQEERKKNELDESRNEKPVTQTVEVDDEEPIIHLPKSKLKRTKRLDAHTKVRFEALLHEPNQDLAEQKKKKIGVTNQMAGLKRKELNKNDRAILKEVAKEKKEKQSIKKATIVEDAPEDDESN